MKASRLARAAAILVLVTIWLPAGAASAQRSGHDGDPHSYRPPLDAAVTDPFRPPAQPWLSGNRGLEYAPLPGSGVHAIGLGVVVFAGPVAGALFVTILHPDGLRSSYSYLAAVQVTVGTRVLGGDLVGVAAAVFHLGVRQGDQYIDPASLFGQEIIGGSVFLVPLGGGAGRPSELAPGAPSQPPGPGTLVRAETLAKLGPVLVHVGLRLKSSVAEAEARGGAHT